MGTECCYITRENNYSKIKYNFMIIRFLKCQEKTEQDQLSNVMLLERYLISINFKWPFWNGPNEWVLKGSVVEMLPHMKLKK